MHAATIDPIRSVTRAGERVLHRTLTAITLSALFPVLVMTYVIGVHVVPTLEPEHSEIYLLALSTVLAMLTGASVLWDVARKVSSMADALARRDATLAGGHPDELTALTDGVVRTLARIDGQADEIRSLAVRLAAVHEELERARHRLADPVREEHHRALIAESLWLDTRQVPVPA